MNHIELNYRQIKDNIHKACENSNRDPREVRVIAVTKYLDIHNTLEVINSGFNHIGESRAQQSRDKLGHLPKLNVNYHFIGNLQKNKAKYIVGDFQYLHSLDKYSLAAELSKRLVEEKKILNCFIQVNVARENSKKGIYSEELEDFSRSLANLNNIKIIGLMTMAPKCEKKEEVRPIFKELKSLQSKLLKLNDPLIRVQELSMGMSNDYTIAVEEGATFIRIGTALVAKN